MDPMDALAKAWDEGGALIAGLCPEDFEATALGVYTSRYLLNHVLGEALMMTEANRGKAGSNERGDVLGSTPAETWLAIGRDNVASWCARGLDGDRVYVYGTFPGQASILINLGEVLIHNWDLAVATRQLYTLDPELAELVYGLYSSIPLDALRAGGQFGPEVPIPSDAPVADRLLGLLGRQPVTTDGNRPKPAIARAATAETFSLGCSTLQLLLDATPTGGALSAHRVHLSEGQLGANPHRHTHSSELFFVVDGSLDVLAGEQMLTATLGDLVVVPPEHPHAFAASEGCRADVLVMITPGIDRFPLFRTMADALRSGADSAAMARSAQLCDTYAVESNAWDAR